MTEKYKEVALRDFVAWVRYRQPHGLKFDSNNLEYIAGGVERFLEGKTPWVKPKGNTPKPSLMWHCHYLVYFTPSYNDPYAAYRGKSHKDVGGLYGAVGRDLNLSASAVEHHVKNAIKLCQTIDGQVDFSFWLANFHGANYVSYTPSKNILPNSPY